MVGHEKVAPRFARYRDTSGYNRVINLRQFGGAATDLAKATEGPFLPESVLEPDTTYRDQLTVEIGNHGCRFVRANPWPTDRWHRPHPHLLITVAETLEKLVADVVDAMNSGAAVGEFVISGEVPETTFVLDLEGSSSAWPAMIASLVNAQKLAVSKATSRRASISIGGRNQRISGKRQPTRLGSLGQP